MSFDTWLAFIILEVFLCLTPGPAVLFVTMTTAAQGVRAGFIATGGILASNLMYFVVSATGVAAVLLASPALFEILRWGGSAYLLYLGLRMLFSPREVVSTAVDKPLVLPAANISLLHGFMVQTLNPKAIAFFVALLPQFVNPEAPIAAQVLILTVTSISVEAIVMALYIWLTLRLGQQAGSGGRLWFKRSGGAFLILAALRLAVAS